MNNLVELKKEELREVDGGYRSVIRTDIDGDGRWDLKEVYKNGELVKTVLR